MFCSNCGKTLKPDATSCPNCGAVVGESRFDGHPYTGAQVRTKPTLSSVRNVLCLSNSRDTSTC